MEKLMTIHASFRPGTDIESAFREAITIAFKLHCEIDFVFNGVTCCARPNSSAEIGIDRYHKERDEDLPVKIAISWGKKDDEDNFLPVSSLEGVQIMIGRRVGNTTRIIDNIIQSLFQGRKVRIVDHSPSRGSLENLEHRLSDRLEHEHRGVGIDFDRNKGIISLKR